MTAIKPEERTVLRDLARRVRDIGALPEQERKRGAWKALNSLQPGRPLVLCFPEGAWLECIPPQTLQCADPLLRGWETRLRMAVYTHEFLADDQPIDAAFHVPWHAGFDGWGVEPTRHATDDDKRQVYYMHPYVGLSQLSHSELGAFKEDAPLKERADLKKLRVPQLHVDRETSDLWLHMAQDLFGDILEVRRRGNPWNIVGGFPVTAVQLRGMEPLWLDLYDDPEWVKELLRFLADAHHAQLDALEREGLLTLNNGPEWIGTGGIGYTDELPVDGFDPAHVRLADIWGGVQAQDLVGISPDMFEEFFYPLMKPIMERFGLAHYGCCEAADPWLPSLLKTSNLRRLSISPWANVAKCAEALEDRCVFSYKPLPTCVTTEHVDEQAIRRGLEEAFTIAKAHGCVVEVMLKDLHTVRHQPERLRRWIRLAREAVALVCGEP
jgi:hypothetical protein